MSRTTVSGAYYTATNAPLWTLIQNAYDVRAWQFIAPDSLRNERVDINAKLPAGAAKEQIDVMLQSLLAERFGLLVHRETRDSAIYELLRGGGGLKLVERASTADRQSGFSTRNLPTDGSGWPVVPSDVTGLAVAQSNGDYRWIFRGQPLSELVNVLQNHLHQTVIDKTGLTRKYDFDLTIMSATSGLNARVAATSEGSKEVARTPIDPVGPVSDAVTRLGLRLSAAKGPVSMLVVDSVNVEPTEN